MEFMQWLLVGLVVGLSLTGLAIGLYFIFVKGEFGKPFSSKDETQGADEQ